MVFGADIVAFGGCMHAWALVFILVKNKDRNESENSLAHLPFVLLFIITSTHTSALISNLGASLPILGLRGLSQHS